MVIKAQSKVTAQGPNFCSGATTGSRLLPRISLVSKGAWVSTLVLIEATWVLTAVYELTHAQISTAIDMLLHHRDLTIQKSGSVAAALEHYRSRPGLGFSDCLILEAARKAGHLPLGTFDRDLSKLVGAERL